MLIQLTGLSGAGKTTISNLVKKKLEAIGIITEIIDGDFYRKTICKDLGFSKEDRHENIRRLGNLAFEFSQKNIVAIVSAINPYEEIRSELKQKYCARTVHIACDINTLFTRDTKGLYKRSLLRDTDPLKIHNLTGINDTYETPVNADIVIRTDNQTIEKSVEELYDYIMENIT